MTLELLALILPLALDTFAVTAAVSLSAPGRGDRWRVALVVSACEGGMPLVGLALGAPLGRSIGSAADLVAIAVLLALGLYMLVGEGGDDGRLLGGERRGWPLVALGLSVSLDELAIGFTLGLLRAPVVLVIAAIAVQAFLVAQLGLRVGGRLGARVREGAERLAAVALTALGIGLLVRALV